MPKLNIPNVVPVRHLHTYVDSWAYLGKSGYALSPLILLRIIYSLKITQILRLSLINPNR